MPTASGQFLLDDYDQELIDAGFDGISQARRYRWINFAYNRVASKFPWLWEQAVVSLTMNPGATYFTLSGATPDIANFRDIDHVYVTTANQNRKLKRLDSDKVFFEDWLPLDLTAAANRGEPTWYRVYLQRLYILPPPNASRAFDIHIHRRVSQLTKVTAGVTDLPITPQYLDEAIMLASLSVAHRRVHELQLAAQAEVDLGDWMDQMKIDEEWQEPEMQERVEPDRSWL